MAITPYYDPATDQIYSGDHIPENPPIDPAQTAIFYRFAGNSILAVYLWIPGKGYWIRQQQAEYARAESIGYSGSPATTRRPADAYVVFGEVPEIRSFMLPSFSTDKLNATPVNFEIIDIHAPAASRVVATGVFPANTLFARADQVNMVDSNGQPMYALIFEPYTRRALALRPLGGFGPQHPATAGGLQMTGWLVVEDQLAMQSNYSTTINRASGDNPDVTGVMEP